MNTPPDFCALIDTLNPEQITDRLADLEREKRALRVLLRATRERQRGRRRTTSAPADQEDMRHAN